MNHTDALVMPEAARVKKKKKTTDAWTENTRTLGGACEYVAGWVERTKAFGPACNRRQENTIT